MRDIIKKIRPFSLKTVFIVPFVLQIVTAVGLVGYLSYRSGQKAVEDLANQLLRETAERVSDRINSYFAQSRQFIALNQLAVEQGDLDLTDVDQVYRRLWRQMQVSNAPTALGYTSPTGLHIGVGQDKLGLISPPGSYIKSELKGTAPGTRIYSLLDEAGQEIKTLQTLPNWDPRKRSWYQETLHKNAQIWTEIYPYVGLPVAGIDLSTPVSRNSVFKGILNSVFMLDHISSFLEELDISTSGQVFIIERSGNLVATSTQEQAFVKNIQGKQLIRLKATESRDQLTRTTMQALLNQDDNLASIQHANFTFFGDNSIPTLSQRHFVHVEPYQDDYGLDWLIVSVVPESDFMTQIYANIRTTIILCIATLIIATGLGIITARWVTQPLLKLNQSAKKLAQGEWEQSVVIQRHDEVGELANSFVQMASQLQASFTELQTLNTALTESESRLNQILEAIPVGISVHDVSGQIIYANQTSKQLLGIDTLPEATTTDLSGTFHVYQAESEELYPVEQMPLVRAFQGEKVKVDDMEIRLPDRRIPLEVYGTPIRNETGTIVAAIATFSDITERKQTEQILADYNQTLATQVRERTVELNEAQRLAHLGNWSFDVNSKKISWSDEVFRICGRDPSQSEPSYEQLLQQIHRDDVAQFQHDIEQAMTEGKSYEHEQRIVRSDGSIRYVLAKGEAILNSSGQVVQLFGTVQDISERKLIEEQLRESEEKFRQLAENIQDVFFILSYTGEILYINPVYEQIWQRTCQSLYDNPRSWLDSVFPEDYPSTVAAMERQLQDSTDFDQVYRITRPNGEIRWIRARSFPVPHQKTYRFVGIAEDITDRKQIELALTEAKDAAETANRAKSTFLANMSHELRTPLNAIMGFTQLMQRSSTFPADYQENLQIIYRSSEHLLTLINQVLDLSKIEAGRITLNQTVFDLYALLRDVENLFQIKARDKGLQLLFDYSDQVPQYVQTDAVKLRQVLINLLSNAFKFTQEGGISVKVSRGIDVGETPTANKPEEITLQFEIEDTGAGMAAEELESIFDAFIQSKTGKQHQEGTGLGLSISRKFVQLMGGDLTVASQVDQGTVFRFEIRVKLADASQVPSQQLKRRIIALESNQPCYRILIVDDQIDNRQLLIQLLNPLGFLLQEATNGKDAIAIWQNWQPHLIFMDMRMPIMDGYEATQQIKATTQGQATAIIAVTASSLDSQKAVILSMGCDGFISKPFRDGEIFDAIHQHLGVNYVYEETTTPTPPNPTPAHSLTPDSLAVLPADWLQAFRQATILGDIELMLSLIEQIRTSHESLANALAELTNQFELEELLTLIGL
ncbi:PAS fold family [Coleofasciculus chthonoplastes PCC 7420]|uniref:Circadian input-output histidine kinase CikA n=1 Tax=Coleofasciculus chthonoplastes PCC 7420 TaxID=118168 RepID=B4VU10_9CYAN|nr:PAS domain S-box protein [Coleofasciculus chthonoplastes]EDX74669.1 PAS fold family [Coleofasciculus chthonoplastes PCC 7420]